MRTLLVAVVLLSGCTVNIVDKRLMREEVVQAFKERDDAIKVIAQKLTELDAKAK